MGEARPRLGVLGGSFDPPHVGHLVIASEAHSRLRLDRVLFVPAAAPPHKSTELSTPAEARLQMTRLAVAGDERFAVSDVEIERNLVYTRSTLQAVRSDRPGHDLYFIMGSDSLLQFDSWHDPRGILDQCTLAVALRPGDDPDEVATARKRWGAKVKVFDAPQIGVSSTELRRRVAEGAPIRYLVPREVEAFVCEQRLYLT